MIELRYDSLVFTFPEVHPKASLRINFQRTLRIPDDEKTYPLPPGFGAFPLRHVDDFAGRIPPGWLDRGGVMLPMYQSEAMWLSFASGDGYPFIVKVAAGKINCITGDPWTDKVNRSPQDYLVVPYQPWLDGYCVEKGRIRQFVAMPLGSGYSAEEQITGAADHGGLQLIVHPMKAEAYDELRAVLDRPGVYQGAVVCESIDLGMGLAPGGRMKQQIYEDFHDFDVWDLSHRSRCFVHIVNSIGWRAITGEIPPTLPPTAEQYNRAGLPWFEYYDSDLNALDGSGKIKRLKSVADLSKEKKETVLPENAPVVQTKTIVLKGGVRRNIVREGSF